MPGIDTEIHDFASTANFLENFNRTWKLENFSELDYACGKLHRSRAIHTGKNDYDVWFLKIYPGGDEIKNDGFVSLNFHTNVIYRKQMRMQCVVQLRNTDDEVIKTLTGKCENFFVAWGFPKVIERTRLLSELTDDVLVIQVKAVFTRASTTSVAMETKIYREVNSEVKAYDMWLQMKHERTDVILAVGEELITTHCAVLVAQSKVFEAMFKYENIEDMPCYVCITDFDIESLCALLQFMYYGSIADMSIDLAEEMLRAADEYDIDDLRIYCSNYLIPRLGTFEDVDISDSADVHNSTNPREFESSESRIFIRIAVFLVKASWIFISILLCLRFYMPG